MRTRDYAISKIESLTLSTARHAVGVLYEKVANGESIRKDRVGFPNL